MFQKVLAHSECQWISHNFGTGEVGNGDKRKNAKRCTHSEGKKGVTMGSMKLQFIANKMA